MSGNAIIELNDVQKYYGDYHALRGITMDIEEGQFFSLLGPSGCGKTTLLRTIAGFEDVSSGVVLIDDKNMDGIAANMRPTNMVFQSYAIFPHLSVGQNVGFGLRRSKMGAVEKAAAIDEALQMVGLAGYGDRAAHALSGGQRQRVALARALILKPKVLLLDEPLSALDKKLREQMQSELRKLQRQVGITFILVTHDQEEALIMSDKIAVMFEGEIAQLASPQDLYKRPSSRRVAEFIGSMNFLSAEVTEASGDSFSVEIPGLGSCRLDRAQCPNEAVTKAASVGVRPESMSVLFDDETSAQMANGTVEEVAYYGDMTYYDVRLTDNQPPVTISMKNIMGRRVLDRGDAAKISWDPRSFVLFCE